MTLYYYRDKTKPNSVFVIDSGTNTTYADCHKVMQSKDLQNENLHALYLTGRLYFYGTDFYDTYSSGSSHEWSSIWQDYSKAKHYLEVAANRGSPGAQYLYACLLENGWSFQKPNKRIAIFYYCQAALQNIPEAQAPLARLHPTLSKSLNVLSQYLHDKQIAYNTPQSKEIIKCFIAFMDMYSYLENKNISEQQQLEKRLDFANLLAIAKGHDIKSELEKYKENVADLHSKQSFGAKKHGFIFTWKGSEHYREHRENCLVTLTHVDAANLKIAADAFSKIIDNDATIAQTKLAQTILAECNKVTPMANEKVFN